MEKTLLVINKMVETGLIKKYAIGGSVAIINRFNLQEKMKIFKGLYYDKS